MDFSINVREMVDEEYETYCSIFNTIQYMIQSIYRESDVILLREKYHKEDFFNRCLYPFGKKEIIISEYPNKYYIGIIESTRIINYIIKIENEAIDLFKKYIKHQIKLNDNLSSEDIKFNLVKLKKLLYDAKFEFESERDNYINKIIAFLPEFCKSYADEDEDYNQRVWIAEQKNILFGIKESFFELIELLETKINRELEYLQMTEALPTEPTTKTPKEFKYFKKVKGKYTKEANCNFKLIAYCLDEIGNQSGEGIVTNIKNAKIFDFKDSNYDTMKTYIKTNDYGKADKAIANDLMQELKQILKEAKII